MNKIEKIIITASIAGIIAFFIMLCHGCSYLPKISLSPNAETVAVQIAARHIGEKVAARYPEYVETAQTIAQGILAAQNPEAQRKAFEAATALLLGKVVKNDDLRADIRDLLSMVQVGGVRLIPASVEGFQEGIAD